MTIESVKTTTATSRAEVERIFELQSRHQWVVRASTSQERKQRLMRLKEVLLAHADEAVAALTADLGRPAGFSEVWPPVAKIDATLSKLDEWMAPQVVTDLEKASSAQVRWEARGVVLLFGPWNVPIGLLFEPLVAIIAAGNTAIVKPNELTPAASALSARIIREVFDEREVAVVEGGTDLAEILLEQPFDHIFLTGSPKVGRAVMAAAAKNLATVTLELGGKCPAIIDQSTDLDIVIPQIGETKMSNGGQVCLSVDYVLVPHSRVEEFASRLSEYYTTNYYVDGVYQSERTARVVNRPNFERVAGYIDDAVARGAKVVFGGATDMERLVVEPTILTGVPVDADVMQAEIFGPILPIIGYENLDEAIAHVRKGTKPLAMYIFSDVEDDVERILSSTSSGGVSINGCMTHYWEDSLPFGGVGDSGIGRYHGVDGFRELSNPRAVAVK
ncbi:aldehyde dehydrogenase family protein [Nocardia sp. NPDC050378]|uniref:aldehyde dehydrogenase family protein n=1 Tax=Nocardia sp. NPDC050378 TaxID=3155400 RepID=UPI0033D84B48